MSKPSTNTFRILFPLIVTNPFILNQHFNQLKTIVLSFSKTVARPYQDPDGSDWKIGTRFCLRIDGLCLLRSPIVINTSPVKPEAEIRITIVATEHTSHLMLDTLAENDQANLFLNCKQIQDAIMTKLRPIHDAVKAADNDWIRDGDTGLFTIDTAETLRPLGQKYIPRGWK